jgi:hypothetical protein
VHAEVAAQDESALESEQEVLAHRLDALESPSVEPLGEPQHGRARVRRLDGDDLSLEHAKALGRAMEGVALRHAEPRDVCMIRSGLGPCATCRQRGA